MGFSSMRGAVQKSGHDTVVASAKCPSCNATVTNWVTAAFKPEPGNPTEIAVGDQFSIRKGDDEVPMNGWGEILGRCRCSAILKTVLRIKDGTVEELKANESTLTAPLVPNEWNSAAVVQRARLVEALGEQAKDAEPTDG